MGMVFEKIRPNGLIMGMLKLFAKNFDRMAFDIEHGNAEKWLGLGRVLDCLFDQNS
jgi:hypothetical protein